jgi:hypothetical protein
LPDISHLIIRIDSNGVTQATGNFGKFVEASERARKSATGLEKSAAGLGKEFATFQLIINKLPGPLKSIASGMMGMVSPATAATGAIIEVIESMGRLVGEGYAFYQEQEVQIARLGAVLHSTGAEAWTTSNQLESLALSLQGATGRSSNEIMQMQSVLLGFTSITGEQFDRLANDMINMADVMGGGLVGSANAFGKALDMPAEGLSALTRYGFKFTLEQKNMIMALEDAGRHSEAQAVILGSMEQAFGDAAEKTREAKDATVEYTLALAEFRKAAGRALEEPLNGMQRVGAAILNWYSNGLNDMMDHYETMSRISSNSYETGEDGLRTLAGALQFTQDHLYATQLESERLRNEWDLLEAGAITLSDKGVQRLQEALYNVNQDLGIYESALENIVSEQKRIANATANDPLKAIKDLYANLGDDYKKTGEGGEKEIQGIIKLYQRMKTELENVSEYEVHMIDVMIEMYQEKQKAIKISLNEWQQLLQSTLDISDQAALEGLAAVEEYTAEFYDRLTGALSYAQMAGEDAADVYGEFADEIERAMKALMYSGKFDIADNAITGLSELLSKIESLANVQPKFDVRKILGLKETKNDVDAFMEYLFYLDEHLDVLDMVRNPSKRQFVPEGDRLLPREGGVLANGTTTNIGYTASIKEMEAYASAMGVSMGQVYSDMEQEMRSVIEGLYNAGVSIPENILEKYREVKDKSDSVNSTEYSEKYNNNLQHQLDLLTMSREERERQLLIDQGIGEEYVDQALALQRQVDAYKKFNNTINGIKDTLANIGLEGAVSMLQDLGAALATGADAGNSLGESFKKVVQGILNMLPTQFISAGLQAIIMGNWPLGLGLIAAGGGMALLGGALGSGEDMAQKLQEEREKEIKLIESLNAQYTKLMDSIEEQEEYYLKKRRELNADYAIENVNDMILTPHGGYSTNPEDFIIATRNPGELMKNGAGSVYVNIINNAAATVTAQEQTGPDGTRQIMVLVDQVVQNGIASGKYDGAFYAKQARDAGRRVSG